MAVDPEISLGVQVSDQSKNNPLTMIGQFASIQNALNQNRMFQQTFAARQRAGEILAGSDPNNPEAGIRGLMSDPLTAPFASEIVNNMRNAQHTLIQMQGEQQTQAGSALGAFYKNLGPVLANPNEGTWNGAVNSTLASISPGPAKQNTAQAIQDIYKSLTWGNPNAGTFNNRLIGLMTANGVSKDSIEYATGKQGTISQGGATLSGTFAPPQMGGGFTPSTATPMTLAPQVIEPGGPGTGKVVVGGSAGTGNALTGAPSSASPLTGPPQIRQQPAPLAGGSGPSTGGATSASTPTPLAFDGKPLWSGSMQAPSLGKGIAGVNILSKPQQDQASKLNDEFNTTDLKQFKSVQQALGSMQYMDNAYDTMIKNGGFLVPGAAAGFRTDLAKGVNTIAQTFGEAPPFDPTKVASAEDFNKETKRMALMVTNQFLGGQREAATVIQGITQSVPGIENTYMGGKLLLAGLSAASQRVIDERNFLNQWQQRNQGNLTGGAEAFAAQHPAEDYAHQVLDKFGMTENGFATPDAVKAAVTHGYLTRAQGIDTLKSQFGMQ